MEMVKFVKMVKWLDYNYKLLLNLRISYGVTANLSLSPCKATNIIFLHGCVTGRFIIGIVGLSLPEV